jgi:hypothetical protein
MPADPVTRMPVIWGRPECAGPRRLRTSLLFSAMSLLLRLQELRALCNAL